MGQSSQVYLPVEFVNLFAGQAMGHPDPVGQYNPMGQTTWLATTDPSAWKWVVKVLLCRSGVGNDQIKASILVFVGYIIY